MEYKTKKLTRKQAWRAVKRDFRLRLVGGKDRFYSAQRNSNLADHGLCFACNALLRWGCVDEQTWQSMLADITWVKPRSKCGGCYFWALNYEGTQRRAAAITRILGRKIKRTRV